MFVLSPEDLRCPANGKAAYVDETSALQRLEIAWTRAQRTAHAPLPCRAYRCPECGWWHLSSHWEREA